MAADESSTELSLRRLLRVVGAAAILLIGGLGAIGATAQLSGAVIAVGSIVVESNVKAVKHRTGGIVGELLVDDGAHVNANDVLIRLDPTEAQANLSAISKELWELAARRARLEAERDASDDIQFSGSLLEAATDADVEHIIDSERKLFKLRRSALAGQKAQLNRRIAELKAQIGGFEDQMKAKNDEIDLVGQELVAIRKLWEQKLVPLTRITELERNAARLRGERGQLTASKAAALEKIAETELQIIQLDENLRSEDAKQLGEIQSRRIKLTEERVTARDRLAHIDIRAPQNGVVQQLAVHASGAVIQAGEQMMLIVPESDRLVVDVHVRPQDIEQVSLGQSAALRFPSFNKRTTPELYGTVSRIAPDVVREQSKVETYYHGQPKGEPYYLVRVIMSDEQLQRLSPLKLLPGMPVEAFLRTDARSLLSYIFKPIADQASRAFREN